MRLSSLGHVKKEAISTKILVQLSFLCSEITFETLPCYTIEHFQGEQTPCNTRDIAMVNLARQVSVHGVKTA